MSSPSEDTGLGMGIVLVGQHRSPQTFVIDDKRVKVKLVCKFMAVHRGRRHYLTSYAKSRPGAWRQAVRWLKKIWKGAL